MSIVIDACCPSSREKFAMSEPKDKFLSSEDLDLRNLSDDELAAYWNLWLRQAQATNDLDEDRYSHGVFDRDPAGSPFRDEILE